MADEKVWTVDSTNDWNATIVDEFRRNAGRVGGRFADTDLLVLHTVGARTGIPRVTPLMYLADGTRFILFATYAGNPQNPAWYHNLKANSSVTIEIPTVDGAIETVTAQAAEVTGAERDALYARQVEAFPGFGRYEQKSGRTIPVVVLERT